MEENTRLKICEKMKSNEYKICDKKIVGKSEIWDLFGQIEDQDGNIVPMYVCCRICFGVYKFDGRRSSNLNRHTCFREKQKCMKKVRTDLLETTSCSNNTQEASCLDDDDGDDDDDEEEEEEEDTSVANPSPVNLPESNGHTATNSKIELERQLIATIYEIDQHNYSYIFDRCKAFDINERQLRYLTKEHIRMLIPTERLGILAEFEFLHAKWKRKFFAELDEAQQKHKKPDKGSSAKTAATNNSSNKTQEVPAKQPPKQQQQQQQQKQPEQQPQPQQQQAQQQQQPVLGSDDIKSLLVALTESNSRLESHIDRSNALHEQIWVNMAPSIPTAPAFVPEWSPPSQFKQIDSIEDIEEFESQLESKEFYEQLCPKFYGICGPASHISGENACYRYIDAIFSRRFFTLVTWTGLSRSKENKENFSKFTRTFKFFHHLVNRCDISFTEDKLKNFFQKIIDNSKRRYEVAATTGIRRMSHVKRVGIPRKRTRLDDDYAGSSNDNMELCPVVFIESATAAPQAVQIIKQVEKYEIDDVNEDPIGSECITDDSNVQCGYEYYE